MNKFRLFAIIMIATVLFLGCRDRLIGPRRGRCNKETALPPVTIDHGECVKLAIDDVKIVFFGEVEDVRCPTEVYCFQPGKAVIQLLVSKPGNDAVILELSILGGAPGFLPNESLMPLDTLGLRFTLMKLEPYPKFKEDIPDSCYKATLMVQPLAKDEGLYGRVVIAELQPAAIQLDGFELEGARIEGETLTVDVLYSGGCRKHYFFIFTAGPFLESLPAQANLYIRHYANFDFCRQLVEEELSFDISPIIELYKEYNGKLDPIGLNVYGYWVSGEPKIIRVLYEPS